MAAQLHIFSPETCLVEQLAAELRPRDVEQLRRTLIIVPTQRLGTVLLVRLLQERPALIPPTILTLESLLRSQAETKLSPAADATLDLMLRHRLEEHSYRHLRVGHERELRLLYGELFDHGLRDSALDKLREALEEDIYKNETHLGSLYDRALEMQDIFAYLDQALLDAKLICRSAALAQAAEAWASAWDERTEAYEGIAMLGFTSMAGSWQTLLDRLLSDARVSLWMSEAPDLYHASSPLSELLQRIKTQNPRILKKAAAVGPRELACFAAGNIRDEVEWAYRIVQNLRNKGIPDAKIAILVTDEQLYGLALRSIFEEDQLNIALPETWASSLAGRHLHALAQFWNEKESLATLIAWLDHPLTQDWWEAKRIVTGELPRLDRFKVALMKLGTPGQLRHMHREASSDLQEAIKLLQDELMGLEPHQTKSLGNWISTLKTLVQDFHYWDAFAAKDVQQSSLEVFDSFCSSLHALGNDAALISGQSFWDLVDSHLLGGAVRGTGEPLSGIQVLGLAEARYFPFEAAILLGCHEGCFPKALPQDELLDNYLKKAMGLPGWEVLEAMEDQTFHLLKARLPKMILMRSTRLGEELLVRSRFTESLIAKGELKEISLPAAFAPKAQAIARPLPEEGHLLAWLESATDRMSSSRLERLLNCPYSFLLDSLGVHTEGELAEDGDTRREGEWLHDVLQVFITGRTRQRIWTDPWQPHPRADLLQQAVERFRQLTDLMAPQDMKESALVLHLKEHAWPAYARHLIDGVQAESSRREWSFGGIHQTPVRIEVDARMRDIHGRLDAIDFSGTAAFVTDFKRRSIPGLEKSKRGLNPQLAFYAMALQQQSPVRPLPPLVLGYWSIYDGKWQAHGVDDDIRPQLQFDQLCTKQTPSVEGLCNGVVQLWTWRERHIKDQERFYADPTACGLCNYAGICRKEDPRARDRVAAQNYLEQRKAFDE